MAECSGDVFVADGGGLSDGDGFSVVLVDELSVNVRQTEVCVLELSG